MIKKQLQDNNFDILRLFFAIFVIVTHSFVLSGFTLNEPLSNFTKGQINFSYIGLRGFFIISGFLIFQSFERSNNIFDFMWKRILRIFPGLLVISVLSIFVVGPIISKLSLLNYFSNKNTYLVLFESIDLFFERNLHTLPGVFDKNIYSPEINGSLWTISYEFLFYFGFVTLYFTKNRFYVLIALTATIIAFVFYKIRHIDPWFKYEYFIFNSEIGVKSLYDFGIFFIVGAFFACINYDKLETKYHKIIFGVSFSIITALLYFQLFNNFLPLLLVPCILSLGLLNPSKFDVTKKTGDISYGIYLSGFFIQQFFMSIYAFSAYQLLALSLLTSVIYGHASWKYVEKPALLNKNKFKNFSLARL